MAKPIGKFLGMKFALKSERLFLVAYANFIMFVIGTGVEIYMMGTFPDLWKSLPLAFSQVIYFANMRILEKFPNQAKVLSSIERKISITVVFFYMFFGGSQGKVPYVAMSTILFIHFQNAIFLNFAQVAKFILELCFLVMISIYSSEKYYSELLTSLSVFIIPMAFSVYLYTGHLHDIQKPYEESFHMKLNEIASILPDGILILDKSLTKIFENSFIQSLTTDGDILKYISSLSYDSSPDFLVDDISKTFLIENDSEIFFGTTSKENKIIGWKGKKIFWDNLPCILIHAQDVTKLVALKAESVDSQYKSVLLRTVSHELRTPTNAILSISEILKENSDLSEADRAKVNIVYCSCSYLLCLINDLLDYSQIMAGCLKVSCVSFNLSKLVNDCLELIEMQVGQRPVKVRLLKRSEISSIIFNDPNRLKQVLLNLLSNSLKFTKSGSIIIEISENEPYICFAVKDTGVGIPKNKISSLFKQFGKLEANSTLNPQGAGLGLYISNMLVYKLGGQGIEVNSRQGVGSTFSFQILLENSIDEPTPEIKNNVVYSFSEGISSIECNPRNEKDPYVLIVDDTFFNIVAFQHIFEIEGIKSDFATTGYEAIQKVKLKEYDCILMDCEMPELDGWATTSELKKMKESGKLRFLPPIIGNSSYNSDDIQESCLASGMQDVITKPCPRQVLTKKIRYWVSLKSKHGL